MSATNQSHSNLTEATILVVDDSKTVRQSASGFLSDMGWSVVTAIDGFDALAKVVDCRPALVFADIMMPRLDGYQTCALIKNNPDYRSTPVVMLSSKDGLFDRARGKVVGADDHLAKPFTREELKEAVAQQLRIVSDSEMLDETAFISDNEIVDVPVNEGQ